MYVRFLRNDKISICNANCGICQYQFTGMARDLMRTANNVQTAHSLYRRYNDER